MPGTDGGSSMQLKIKLNSIWQDGGFRSCCGIETGDQLRDRGSTNQIWSQGNIALWSSGLRTLSLSTRSGQIFYSRIVGTRLD